VLSRVYDPAVRKLLIALPAALLFSASCEKEAAPTTAPEPAPVATEDGGDEAAGEEGGDETAEAEGPKAWGDMTRKERMNIMGTQVMPKMKEAFAAHDADNWGDLKCQSCHGDDMKEVDFKMPNALTPLGADPIASGKDMDEEVTKFMAEVVMVQMGEMMNLEVQEDGLGPMGCFSCHLKEE
jgi:hypothetical protein